MSGRHGWLLPVAFLAASGPGLVGHAAAEAAAPAPLACGRAEQAAWRRFRSRVRDHVVRLATRLPFSLFRSDIDSLQELARDLEQQVGMDDEVLERVEDTPELWTECGIGALTVRLLFALTRMAPGQAPYAAAQLLPAVLRVPWVEVLLTGWPIFTSIVTFARWASPQADPAVAEVSGTNARAAAEAARELSPSTCDGAEAGAMLAARHVLGRLWRLRHPAYLRLPGEPEAPEVQIERALAGLLDDGSASQAEQSDGAAKCRWTEHAGRYLGGEVETLEEGHMDIFSAMSACAREARCAGFTAGPAPDSDLVRVSFRRGEPLLHESPTGLGESSFVRWCSPIVLGASPVAPPCPCPTAAGLLAVALRRLGRGSLGDFAPELVSEAQSLIAGWAAPIGSPNAEFELWATEWPVWELLGKLQERVDLLSSPATDQRLSPPPQWATALQRAVGFSDDAWRMAIEELMRTLSTSDVDVVPAWLRESVHCASGGQCLGELHARLHLLLHSSGALPLRDPISLEPEDALSPAFMARSRALADGVDYDWGGMVAEEQQRRRDGITRERSEELDRLMPSNHPLQVDRRQLANFVLEVREAVAAPGGIMRCLEWDQPFILVRAFQAICRWTDVFSYSEPSPDNPMMGLPGRHEYPHGTRHYWGDLEHPDGPGIEPETFDLVVCPFVFEHVSQPFLAMRNLARLLKPGGHIIWAAPMFQQYHGSPHDYFRYTPQGARALATHSGLEVARLYAPGDLALTSGLLLGMLLPYWSEAHALAEEPPRPPEDSPRHPVNVFALLRRPAAVAGAKA